MKKQLFGVLFLCNLLTLSWVSPASAHPSQAPVIMLDPGHGGIDGGTQSSDGTVLEKDLNLQITLKLAELLKKDGFQVEFTRDQDVDVTRYTPDNPEWGRHKRDLVGRVEASKQKRAQIFISLHGNHGTTRNTGSIVFYRKNYLQGYLLAHELQSRLNTLSGMKQVPRSRNYYVLNANEIPAVLVEYGYLSNPDEVAQLTNPAYQEKIAQRLREGIRHYMLTHHLVPPIY